MNESSGSSVDKVVHASDSAAALVLPDWSGQIPRSSRVQTDEWLSYCRANLMKLRSRPGYEERRRRNGIAVEFSLENPDVART